jgi:hypothetical protein
MFEVVEFGDEGFFVPGEADVGDVGLGQEVEESVKESEARRMGMRTLPRERCWPLVISSGVGQGTTVVAMEAVTAGTISEEIRRTRERNSWGGQVGTRSRVSSSRISG